MEYTVNKKLDDRQKTSLRFIICRISYFRAVKNSQVEKRGETSNANKKEDPPME